MEEASRTLDKSVRSWLVHTLNWDSSQYVADIETVMTQLQKRVILSPEQLDRLLGRDKELISQYDRDRVAALRTAAQRAPKVGATQAYSQYQSVQQRHLQRAARERAEPLELVIADASETQPLKQENENVSTVLPTQPEPKPMKSVRKKDIARQKKHRAASLEGKRKRKVVSVAGSRVTRSGRITKPYPLLDGWLRY